MDTDGSLLERLRQQLADLESSQRATGTTAGAGFWSTSSPDAAEPGAGATDPGAAAPNASDPNATEHSVAEPGASAHPGLANSPDRAGADPTGSGRGGGFRWPLRLSWPVFLAVPGRLAPTFAFAAGITTLRDLPSTALDEADLLECVNQLGRVQHHREVNLVRLVGEIEARGVPSPGGLSRVDWLRVVDPTLTASAAKAVVTCAAAFNQPRWAQLRQAVTGESVEATEATEATPDGADSTGCDRGPGDGGSAAGATVPQPDRVTVGKAAQIVDFHTRLKPIADPDELHQAVTHLSEHAPTLRWEQLAKLARELSDQVRPPKNAEDHDQKRRDARGLWFTSPNAAGMVGMSGTFDPEGAAIIKSAIDPLAAPCPLTDEEGARMQEDPRPAHQRRMDALLDVIARGVSAPGKAPRTDKAKIVVTINFDTLRDWVQNGCPPDWATTKTTGSGTNPSGSSGADGGGGGSCLTGDVLSAATVRRMACDAAIIPVVLGSDSRPLDVGRQERLVTRGMRTALWLRDGGCTFPGCSTPAQWTDAHHVRHWLHGGTTSLGNLALLCRRHHVYVHHQDLTATITATKVIWHTWQHWGTTSTTDTDPGPPPGSTRPSHQTPPPHPEADRRAREPGPSTAAARSRNVGATQLC